MSKWIDDVENCVVDWDGARRSIVWNELVLILEKVDKLLRESAAGTDNENLADRIKKEIKSE